MKRYIKSSKTNSFDWRNLSVGDKLLYCADDFDGSFCYPCTVKAIFDDHAVVEELTVPMRLWLDDDTAYMFKKEG